MLSGTRSRPRSGLTLPEVVGLICILALVLALLFPTLMYLQRTGQPVTCQRHLKSIGIGIQQYVHYWDGYFPYYRGHATPWDPDLHFTWRDVVRPCVVGCKIAPADGPEEYDRSSDRGNGIPELFTDPVPGTGNGRYLGSRMVFRDRPSLLDGTMVEGHLHQSQVLDPRNTPVVGPASKQLLNDDGGPDFRYNTFYYSVGLTYTGAVVPGNRQHLENIDFRHIGRANILFLDLHIESYDENDPADRARLAALWNTIDLRERDKGESGE